MGRRRTVAGMRWWSWLLLLLLSAVSVEVGDAAFLTIQFPIGDTLAPPGPNDIYTFVFAGPDSSSPTQVRFVTENYTAPLIIPNAPPTTAYNVTVFINNTPLPVRRFVSGPDPPTGLQAEVSSPIATKVRWNAPTRGAVQQYRLQLVTRDPSGSVSQGSPITWNSTVIRITPLIPGTEYTVEVVSLFDTFVSEPVTTTFTQFPATPRNFRKIAAATNESTIAVQWDPSEGTVDGYYLEINSPTLVNYTGPGLLPVSARTASFPGLRPGEVYGIAISAVRLNWNSTPAIIKATTNPLPPAEVREVPASEPTRSVSIAWAPPKINGEAANYRVSLNASEIAPKNTSDNYATWDNLIPGTTYAASVESFVVGSDGASYSKPVRKVLHTGALPPLAAGPLPQVPPNPNSNSPYTITAIESAPELSVESNDPAIRFLEANATSEDNTVANGEITDGRLVYFRGLMGGTLYSIYVKLLQNDVETVVQFDKLTYPIPPVNVSINATHITPESVLLEWSRPTGTRLRGYEVLYNRHDDTAAAASANATTVVGVPDSGVTVFNLTGLAAGTKYAFRMRSVIEDVHSVATIPLLQCTRPPKPLGVSVKPMSVKLFLQLTRPSNTTKYYRVRLLNMDLKDVPPRTMDIRNDSAVVQVPIPVDYLGAVYEVRVSSFMCDLSSDIVTTVVNSLPPVVNFNRPPAEVTQTSIKVVYQSTWPIGRSIFTRYAFQISGMPPKYVLPSEVKTQTVEFTNLVPGTKYTISAWTERGEIQSDRKSLEVQLKPDNMTEMNATKITSRNVAFQWTPPNGTITQYEIGYNNTEPVFTNLTSWDFNNLLPFKIYSVYVAAWSGTERSSALTRFYTTLEDKPGRVRLFNLSALQPFRLLARWAPPDVPNGIITGYLLDYKENNSATPWTHLTFGSMNVSQLLTLDPGKSYILRIAAVNSAGIGPAQDAFMTMPLGAPVLSRTGVRPTTVSTTKNSITVQFSRDFFQNRNGDVVNYTVVVAEEPMHNLSRNLPGWRDVQGSQIWPPYQALEPFNPFEDTNGSSSDVSNSFQRSSDPGVVQVTIGNAAHCDTNPGRYCNGPLRESTKYFVKIRAFTSMAEDNPLFTDTIYTDDLVTEAPTSSALGIVLGICIPVILIILLGMSLVLMRKYSWGPFVKKARKAAGKGAIEDKISITESISEKSRPVKLRDFAEHVRVMTADSDFKFSEEYEDLKHVGRDQACAAADLPVNRAKNRFTNILPYDHSRVKLMPTDDEEGSDYINSNYMPGFNGPREFIVTQGPLPSTRDDFWRMIWEQNCRAIVMLTRCVEKGREKCDHYWPYDTDAVVYGDVDVTVMNESQTSEWTIREFRVAKNDEPARSVRQFHFTGWPDFGVPERPQALIKFVRAFRERVFTDVKPIVVHCSAGVGRSGTFIALDRLLQQIRIADSVDIFGMVCEMRRERVWMVQTEQQYICIHQCLLCVMEGRENDPGAFDTGMHENPCYEISDDEGIVESGPF
ncbi:Tyrosine-protein phosphatase 10D [Hypsibius exemplaris]|uniref:protein-tyrosine-phosphatase n=1 Tax=Hypsibius exemplaris TaxID=2072580 RepID=A0A1W0WW28_HYPEX|nr:Tyrosine-protein phosphatase 10D [Hypsibius exemplaris]